VPRRRTSDSASPDASTSSAYHGGVPQDHDGSPPLDEPLNQPPGPDPSPPSGGPASPPPPATPGLGEQIGATKAAASRLVGAHVELLKAEVGDIAEAVKRAAILVGLALGAGLVAGLVLIVGLPLFLGEWLFGSIGWGLLLGPLLLLAIAVAALVVALRPGVHAGIGGPLLVGIGVGIAVGLALGSDLTNRAWTAAADALVPGMDAAYRPLVVAVVGLFVIGAVLGAISGAIGGGGGASVVAALIVGGLVGLALGLLTAIAPGARVGGAIGVSAGLIAWIALMAGGVARGGFDMDALKTRFWPERTIAVTKETIEWARERMPLSRRS